MFLVSAAQIVRISIHKAWNRARDNIRSHSHIECTTRSATVKQNKRALSTRAVLRHRCVVCMLHSVVFGAVEQTLNKQTSKRSSRIIHKSCSFCPKTFTFLFEQWKIPNRSGISLILIYKFQYIWSIYWRKCKLLCNIYFWIVCNTQFSYQKDFKLWPHFVNSECRRNQRNIIICSWRSSPFATKSSVRRIHWC